MTACMHVSSFYAAYSRRSAKREARFRPRRDDNTIIYLAPFEILILNVPRQLWMLCPRKALSLSRI